MAEAKGIFIPYHWVDEITINDDGVVDEEYSREVAWELLKALKAQGIGEEIQWPKDRYIKAIIRGYIQQEKVMQSKMNNFTNNKKGDLTDKEMNDIIYNMRIEGKEAKEIYNYLKKNYGITHVNENFIYKKKSWVKANKDLTKVNSVEIQVDSSEKEDSVGNQLKYDF